MKFPQHLRLVFECFSPFIDHVPHKKLNYDSNLIFFNKIMETYVIVTKWNVINFIIWCVNVFSHIHYVQNKSLNHLSNFAIAAEFWKTIPQLPELRVFKFCLWCLNGFFYICNVEKKRLHFAWNLATTVRRKGLSVDENWPLQLNLVRQFHFLLK